MVGRRKITRKSLLVSLRRVASVWIALKDAFKNFMPSGKAGSNQNSRRLSVAPQRALVDTNYPVVNTITKKYQIWTDKAMNICTALKPLVGIMNFLLELRLILAAVAIVFWITKPR